jgi:hypothetical protein
MEHLLEVDADIATARHELELGLALERLTLNKDFQLLIAQGYLKEELLRTTLDAQCLNNSDRKLQRNERIDAIAYFSLYLANVRNLSKTANQRISEAMLTREAITEDNV